MWPGAPEELGSVFEAKNVPDDDIEKMTHLNALKWYSFDPFKHVPREKATVGALRAAGRARCQHPGRSHQPTAAPRTSWRPSVLRSTPPPHTAAD